MTWRMILLIWPARLFRLWWLCYIAVAVTMFMVVGTLTAIALVLRLVFGIRWGF